MENISIRFIFDRKRVASNTVQGLLQIAVRKNRTSKSVFISTGIKLYKNQFTDKNGFTCVRHEKAPMINRRAKDIFNKIEAFALSSRCRALEDVKLWDRVDSYDLSVVEFIEGDLKRRDPSFNVYNKNRSLLTQIEAFGKIKTFNDLTYDNIVDFDAYLRKEIAQTTLYKKHCLLKSYIVKAINHGLCKSNPYVLFKPQNGRSQAPTYLTSEEMRRVEGYVPINERLQRVKDLFILQSYTGLSYVDLQSLDRSKITDMDGRMVIRSKREKTDESFVVLLLPQAQKILEKYDYVVPKISNQKYNDYLKLLAAGSEIEKRLTSHAARHTFATYLINNDVPIESVSKALGHSSIRQTAHYARMLGKTVIKDMEKLLPTDPPSSSDTD